MIFTKTSLFTGILLLIAFVSACQTQPNQIFIEIDDTRQALVTEAARSPMDPGEALELVDLADRMGHFPAQLSGGEQQRIAIARAIAKRPEVLLCDEPTGALDSKTGVLVLEAIDRVSRELGTTVAIITHNAGIREIARRVFYFKDGRIEREEINDRQISPAEVVW